MRLLAVSALTLGLSLAAAGTASSQAAPFVAGEGQAQTTAACAACHAPAIITGKRYSAEKWGAVVDQMIDKGAKVNDADYDTIVAYLAKNYGTAK